MADYDMEGQLAQLRLKQAYENQQQAQQPSQGRMAGQVYLTGNPIAQALRGYQASQELQGAQDQLKNIGQQRQEATNRDMGAFVQALRGTPAFEAAGPAPQGAPQEGGYQVPAQKGDPYAAYTMAAGSQSPMVRQMGVQGLAQLPQLEAAKAEKEANRAWQEQQRELDRQTRRDIAQQGFDLRREVRNAGAQKVDTGKTLPSGEVDKITGLDESLGTQQRLMQTFKPEYAGYGSNFVGGAANLVGSRFSDKLQPQAEWWAAHEANDNIMRNKLFGASLTAGEQAAWDRTSIKPGMSPEMVQNRMAERAALIDAQRNTRIGNLGKAGYNVQNFGAPPDTFKPTSPTVGIPSADAIAAELARRGGK